MDADTALSVHNLAFLEALRESYERDPSSVDPQWVPVLADGARGPSAAPASASNLEQLALQTRVDGLIQAYRLRGHLGAQLDPIGRMRPTQDDALELSTHRLGPEHLDREFHTAGLVPRKATLREILDRLQNTYCRHVGVEYWHLPNAEERHWLQERMESTQNEVVPSPGDQRRLLKSLAQVEGVDRFLHSKFIGAKRFSISGAESVISLLELLIENAAQKDIGEVILGMAHRGRLSVLMNILGKTPREVFSEFEKADAKSFLGGGDVKYHLGYHRNLTTESGKSLYVALAFNPSHLEAITPVIQGRIRAKQDSQRARGHDTSLGVTLHGDAAFCGQGVVAETLNMSRLEGYDIGGSIRVVINNQIGFTTEPTDSRSGQYCTDVANILGVPVFHVNGDDPEAAAWVGQLALEWRQRFHRDVVIDLVCYRKFGHNEGDDPTFTQPSMYAQIKQLDSVRTRYQRTLVQRGTISVEECEAMDAQHLAEFDAALQEARASDPTSAYSPMHGVWRDYRGGDELDVPDVITGVPRERLVDLAPRIIAVPEGFNVHPKVRRNLEDIEKMLSGDAPVSWAAAELAAYASLLSDGTPVRVSGQDAQRGTFSHRHAVLTDSESNARWCPLRELATGGAFFEIYNSPLSEFSVLGFEFGYSLAAPHCLVVWEAQFGDFVNGAQVIIDQFISSSEDKWNRISGLVMLLPHGYEGQGPEHSSARLERFLQLCAEDNMQICNPTTPAQLFHALRRQCVRNWRKPMIIMSPKSLLRFRRSFSDLSALTHGTFERVLDEPTVEASRVDRLLLCSGKIFYELDAERERLGRDDIAIVRVEQLYPFPRRELEAVAERYGGRQQVHWVQDEPRNMGSWSFVAPQLAELGLAATYVGRVDSASPATGSKEAHKLELEMILEEAFRNA